MITLDIISDPVCPWCLIGKTNLFRALERSGTSPFAIRWQPYLLNPDMPPEGMDRGEYLQAKFGASDGSGAYLRVSEALHAAGIDADLQAITRIPNTVDAHRLMHWAELEGRATPVASQLFHRYFQKGEDISRHEVLLDVAQSAGLDRAVVARLLHGDADREEVIREADAWRERGVTGVPCFIVGGRHAVMGAQSEETWAGILAELAASSGQ